MGKLMTAKIASCAKGCVTGVQCIEWMLCRRQQIKFIIKVSKFQNEYESKIVRISAL